MRVGRLAFGGAASCLAASVAVLVLGDGAIWLAAGSSLAALSAGLASAAAAPTRQAWIGDALAGLLATFAAAVGVLALQSESRLPPLVAAGGFLGVAFALLVLERHLAACDPGRWPDAAGLAALARVPIGVLAVCGIGTLLAAGGIGAGGLAGWVAVVPAAVGAELALRALARLFLPAPPAGEVRAVTSAMASMWARPSRMVSGLRGAFGIDLSRSWAIAFVRAACAPVLAVLLLFGWSLSGVEALRLDQRAIYERLGRPVAVLGPGLHVHLPWPLGRVRPLELGVLHAVPIVFDSGTVSAAALPGAEALPGADADRLWDESHPSEASFIIASLSRGAQSFESVDIDVRVVYRVGLSDREAMAFAVASSDPERLVQSRASRLLAHYFAHHTLDEVLGPERGRTSGAIRSALQSELDAIPSGLDVTDVVVEAIHPPPEAAGAYHAVQTASISAHTIIADAVGTAVEREGEARRDADVAAERAQSVAHETIVGAEVRATLFGADRTANASDPVPFLLERKFDRLDAGLAHRPLLIVDHRLGDGGQAPVIDLRAPGRGPDAVPGQTQ